jgi:hypothetical protein
VTVTVIAIVTVGTGLLVPSALRSHDVQTGIARIEVTATATVRTATVLGWMVSGIVTADSLAAAAV